jgi:hexosaminidase
VNADWRSAGDGIDVLLSNQSGLGTIRYTADGSPVTASSPPYTGPLRLPADAQLAAATFLEGRQLSRHTGGSVGFMATYRWSHELELCTERLVLSLEDDAPLEADNRGVFLVDILNPCWIWRDVDLSGVVRLEASVGQVPFNFQLGADRDKIELAAPRTATGELLVRANGCDGEPIAVMPLREPALTDGLRILSGALRNRPEGSTDLCFRFATGELDPMWVIHGVSLTRERQYRETAAR